MTAEGRASPESGGRRVCWGCGLDAEGEGMELPPSCGQRIFLEKSHPEMLVQR